MTSNQPGEAPQPDDVAPAGHPSINDVPPGVPIRERALGFQPSFGDFRGGRLRRRPLPLNVYPISAVVLAILAIAAAVILTGR